MDPEVEQIYFFEIEQDVGDVVEASAAAFVVGTKACVLEQILV